MHGIVTKMKHITMNYKKNLLAGLALAVSTIAHATPAGSVSFLDLGSPSISPGNDITTASIYTIGALFNFPNGTGVFAGSGLNPFGSVSFDINNPASFSFSNPVFGSFSSTEIDLNDKGYGTISFNIYGTYNSGAFDGGAIVNEPASFSIAFGQAGGPGNNISDTGAFSIPPVAPAPEPTTLAMAAVGGLMGLVAYRRRK